MRRASAAPTRNQLRSDGKMENCDDYVIVRIRILDYCIKRVCYVGWWVLKGVDVVLDGTRRAGADRGSLDHSARAQLHQELLGLDDARAHLADRVVESLVHVNL